jgi:hypothetical protein
MELSEEQIEFIRLEILRMGVEQGSLANSLVDHVCCAIEAHPGSDFNAAYVEAIRTFGDNGMIKIQKEIILISTIKTTEKMKKTMYVTGFLAAFLSSTGLLFKLMHWQGASIMLVLGVIFINLGFLPMYFYGKYKSAVK